MSRRIAPQDRRISRWIWILVIPAWVVLLAFLLRVAHLDAQSIWFDEGWSWYLARLPLGEMAKVTGADRSPLLYYVLLHLWIDQAGESPFAMRYLSVLADTTTVALVIVLAGALFKQPRRAPVAGLLYALCPFAVWYAQEARMYALVGMLCVASTYWLWRWLHKPDPVGMSLAVSAVMLMSAIYSHYYAVFLVPAHGLTILVFTLFQFSWQNRRDWFQSAWRIVVKWALSVLGMMLVLAPWLLIASTGFAYDDGFVFPLNTIDGRIGEWIKSFANGGIALPLPDWWLIALACAGCISCIVLVASKRGRALAFLLTSSMCSLLAAAVAIRVMYPYRSVFHPRYLIYVVPLVVILLGGVVQVVWGQSVHTQPRIKFAIVKVLSLIPVVALGVLWLPALVANYADPAVARDNIHAAMIHVVEALMPGDVVVVTRDNYAAQYYLHTQFAAAASQFVAVPSGLHGILKTDVDYVAELSQYNPKRVRLLLWQDRVVDPQMLVESTLWANGYELGEISFGQIRLPLYQIQQHPVMAVPIESAAVQFADRFNLAGFWMRREGYPGDWFYAVLRWNARQKMDINYKVFIHVLAADGQAVFQRDKLALSDLLPTTTWKVGETVSDAYAMVIPANLPDGEYRVVVGVYDPETQSARLRPQSTALEVTDDSVMLGTLRIHKR